MNSNGSSHIEDDTSLQGPEPVDTAQYSGLADRTNFQSFDASTIEAGSADYSYQEEEDLSDTSVPLWKNPFFIVTIAGCVFGSCLLGLLLFGRSGPELEIVEEPGESETTELTLGASGTTSLDAAGTAEVDQLRSEIALLEQRERLAEVDRTPKPALSSELTETIPASSPSPSSPTAPVSAVRTAPRPVPRPAASPVSRPAPRPVSVAPPPRPAPVAVPPRTVPVASEPIEPQAAWYAASNAGVFGQMPAVEPVGAASIQPVAAERQPQYSLQNVASFEIAQEPFYPSQPRERTSRVPGLTYSGPSVIPMGQWASAVVVTPITWLSEGDQFLISLEESLLDAGGRIAIPEGSSVVVQPVTVDESSGFAELAAVGLMIEGEVIPVDYQTISIKGSGGDPLIAQRYGDIGRDIASNDLEMFAIGAFGGVGEILTRPDSQTITNGAFGGSASTEYGDRNILGAVLSGGAEQLVGRMGERNQSRLDELRSRDQIFYLAEGTSVQFYVNSSFSL